MIRKSIALCIAGVALLTLPRAGLAQDIAGLLEKAAPCIVTVKVVIKTEFSMMGQAQNEESRSELQGVVVHDSGLIMISNAGISADRAMEAISGLGNPMLANMDITMTPTDFAVIFGNEEEEHDAFLVAKDTKLDLAFLQVQGVTDRELVTVNFAEGVKPAVGDTVVAISRLKKGYDYAPFATTARVSGAIRKPRKAWIVDGSMSSYGLPVFSSSGDVVGVLITLAPTTTDDSGGSGFGSMMRMMRGGGLDAGVGTFILPAKVVNGLIKQSLAKVQELLDEQAADG